jgi:hypothetical protein
MKKIEMVGKKFGKLLVIEEVSKNKNGHIKYLCQCDCGNTCEVFGTHLRQNKIISCKCANKIDGVSGDMWYNIINSGVKTRVKRSNLEVNITKKYVNELYKNQDGKCKLSGIEITLPKTWRDRTYTASLDRIDSNEGYIIGNVQWVHKHINVMKNTFPQEMFIYLCNKVSEKNEYKEITTNEINEFKWGLNDKYKSN